MLTSCALSIEFHIILVIVLMTIHVFYISIIYYKLLPMFIIHVSFIHISSSVFTCVMRAFFQTSGYGKRLYVLEGTIIVRDSDLSLYCIV